MIGIRLHAALNPSQASRARAKVDAALLLLSRPSLLLTDQERKILWMVRSIVIVPDHYRNEVGTTVRTSMDVYIGIFTVWISYILSPTINAAMFASVIAHDSYHIFEHRQGRNNVPNAGPSYEGDANTFQISVGKRCGLSSAQIKYLQADRHNSFNTDAY